MAKFKEKNFGLLTGVRNGATVGAALSGGIYRFAFSGKRPPIQVRNITIDTPIAALAGGIIGATLGAIAYGIKSISNRIEKKKAINYRLMPAIVKELERQGHKEGMSFTRDPKHADRLKTKVSIVIYKNSGDLRLIVNTVNDDKLSRIMKDITTKIAKTREAVFREEASDRFKDLKITAISDPSTDAGYIAWIASTFINNGYPVYLVEVG